MKALKRILSAVLGLSLVLGICTCLSFGEGEPLLGDVDGSLAVDNNDAIHLLYNTIFGDEDYPLNQPCDFTCDGKVDNEDAIYLLYHTIFPSSYPLDGSGKPSEPEQPIVNTATATFSCEFEDNAYDTACKSGTVTGQVEHCWGTQFPEITSLITSICPLENVYYLEVTLKASDTSPCWNGVTPKCELHWDSRGAGRLADVQSFTGNTVYLSAFMAEDVSRVILNPYAFNADAGVIDFEVTVTVTMYEPEPDYDNSDTTVLPDNNKPTGDPEMTNFTLADKIIPSEDMGLTISKLSTSYKPADENNPISSNVFFADPTSVEYNGRLYVYGTNDSQQFVKNEGTGSNGYGNINTLVCYSSADLINWTYHGEIPVTKIATWAGCSWAPSIVSREVGDKTEFYLYFCNSGGGVGVLTSDSPTGPWKDPIGKALVHNGMLGDDPVCWCFDPGVVIDDNGVGWLAFGGGNPMHEGETSMYTGNCRLVKLGADMVTLDSEIIKVPAVHHFEANEINMIGGSYVLTYCSNYGARDQWTSDLGTPSKTCSMCYMVNSGDPLNPDDWKYGGEYLTNPNTHGYPFSNNHSHLQKFGNKYYILYQTVSLLENMNKLQTADGYRSIGIDEIVVDEENVVIKKGRMTDKGVSKIADINAFAVHKAETHHSAAGISYEKLPSRGYVVTDISEGDYVLIKNVSFANGADAFAAVVSGKGVVEVRLDSPNGKAVGSVQFDNGDFEAVGARLDETVSGVHDLYLVFGGDFKFDTWQFAYLG